MKIVVYIEGGSSGKQNQSFRLSIQKLLNKVKNNNYKIIACTDTDSTIRYYNKSIDDCLTNNILIIDSEDNKTIDIDNTEFINNSHAFVNCERSKNHHLMVQCMESLYFADIQTLKNYFGTIPKQFESRNCESLSKKEIFTQLDTYSNHKRNREFDKILDGSTIIEKLNPNIIRKKAQHFNLLCSRLEEL